MRNEQQAAVLKGVIADKARRIKGGLIGIVGAALALIKGDNFDLDAFSRRVNHVELNFGAPVLLTLAATTAYADGDWTLTNEKDRFRIILAAGISVGDLDEATRLGDGVLDQLHKLARIELQRTTGKMTSQAFRRFSLGNDPSEQDGLTTLVGAAAPCQTLERELLTRPIEEMALTPVDAQNPDESTVFGFRGLNGVTAGDSANGVQGALYPMYLDAVMRG